MRERLLKFTFFLTLPWALVGTLGLVFEDSFKGYLPTRTSYSLDSIHLMPLVVLYALTFFVMIVLSKISPNFMLISPSIKPARIVKIFILTLIISYFGAAIITFFISNAVITVDASLPNVENEKALLVFLISLYLPLWWILPMSALATVILLNRGGKNSTN